MASKPAWLSWTSPSAGRGRYEDLSMRPLDAGVLASPADPEEEDHRLPHSHGHGRAVDAQTPKRWTALNRPSRTRSWLIVLFFVLLIAVGMGIWSDWQPVDWAFKKFRGGDGDVGMGGGGGGDGDGTGGVGGGLDGDLVPGAPDAAVTPLVTPRVVMVGAARRRGLGV